MRDPLRKRGKRERRSGLQYLQCQTGRSPFPLHGHCCSFQPQPHRTAGNIYITIMARLVREVQGQAWLRYDKLFHWAVAVNPPLPWDRCEPDVWLAAISEHPLSFTLSLTTSCSMAPRGGLEAQEICKWFTRGDATLMPASSDMLACSASHPATQPGTATCCNLHQGGLLHLTSAAQAGTVALAA